MVSCRCPSRRGILPMFRGRKPRGSRAAKTRSELSMTSENAPSTRRSASAIASGKRLFFGERDQVDDDFSVAIGLEDRTLGFQAMTDFLRIHQVAVVGQRNHAFVRLHHDGLGIEQRRIAGGGVARVSDSERAVER